VLLYHPETRNLHLSHEKRGDRKKEKGKTASGSSPWVWEKINEEVSSCLEQPQRKKGGSREGDPVTGIACCKCPRKKEKKRGRSADTEANKEKKRRDGERVGEGEENEEAHDICWWRKKKGVWIINRVIKEGDATTGFPTARGKKTKAGLRSPKARWHWGGGKRNRNVCTKRKQRHAAQRSLSNLRWGT